MAIKAALLRHRDSDEDNFVARFESMLEEGEAKAVGTEGMTTPATGRRRQYDPKARAFVDPKKWQRWGDEAAKGREKRRLFTQVLDMAFKKGRPQLTLPELMALPSSFDSSTGMSDTTIILNHWKRTTLQDQLDAILNQSVKPAGGVWVCLFDSPREREYRMVVESYRERFRDFGGLFLVASSFNFKYYGRFQMALQASTRYVWVVDDDVMPGNKFLRQLNHIAGLWNAEEADGSIEPMALGSVGWVMPGLMPPREDFYSYRHKTDKGGLYLPDKRYGIPVPKLQEVDLLCSHWFVETAWVKLMFRERWETPETGEDYMLAYSLRKYAGVRSYVVPMDLSDSQTWGNMDVDWDMQKQGGGATTLVSTVPMRDRLWHRLFKRGGEYFMSTQYAKTPRPLILVVDSLPDADVLRPLFLELQASYPPTNGGPLPIVSPRSPAGHQRPPRVVLTGRGSISCSKAAEALGNADAHEGLDSTLCNSDSFAAAWDLMAGKHYPRYGTGRAGGSGGRDHVLMVDLAAGFAGAVNTVEPLAIVSVAGSGPAAGRGAQGKGGAAIDEALTEVSNQSGVPLIRLPRVAGASGAALWLAKLAQGAFSAWHRVRIDIIVVHNPTAATDADSLDDPGTHSKAQLQRLLDDLSQANYLGDKLDLSIVVSRGEVPRALGEEFVWPRGRKLVRNPMAPAKIGPSDGRSTEGQETNHDLASLVLRSWSPRDTDNYVLVLEANQAVSPLFYSWLKVAVLEGHYAEGAGRQTSGAGGVCVPGGSDGGDNAWLLSARQWKEAQSRCVGVDGDKPCATEDYRQPPAYGLCPHVDKAKKVLVGRTDFDGQLIPDGTGLMNCDEDLIDLIRDAFPAFA